MYEAKLAWISHKINDWLINQISTGISLTKMGQVDHPKIFYNNSIIICSEIF